MAADNEFNLGDEIKIRVKRSGVLQQITFIVVLEDTPVGEVKMLKTDKKIDVSELLRMAGEYNLPIKDKNNIIVPSGRKLTDFVE